MEGLIVAVVLLAVVLIVGIILVVFAMKKQRVEYEHRICESEEMMLLRMQEEIGTSCDDDIIEEDMDAEAKANIEKREELRTLVGRANELRQRQTDNQNAITSIAATLIDSDDISEYSDVDWLNVFMDSVKNVSSIEMQEVWARVLVNQITSKESFSYKTLDTLKNVSKSEFETFRKAVYYETNGALIITTKEKLGIEDNELRALQEYGLVSSEIRIEQVVLQNGQYRKACGDKHVLIIRSDSVRAVDYKTYPMTRAGKSLMSVVECAQNRENAIIEQANAIREQMPKGVIVELRKYSDKTYNGKRILEGDNLIG